MVPSTACLAHAEPATRQATSIVDTTPDNRTRATICLAVTIESWIPYRSAAGHRGGRRQSTAQSASGATSPQMNIALFLTMTVLASPAETAGAARVELPPAANAVQKTVGEQASGCPAREAVAAALSPALVHIRPNVNPLPSDFRLADLGDAFEVSAGGQVQRYADAARDCSQRARVAAVFVALAMNPLSLEAPRPPPPPVQAVPVPPPPPPAPNPDRNWLSVGVAGLVDGAVGADGDATSGLTAGGEIDFAVGRGSVRPRSDRRRGDPDPKHRRSIEVVQQRFPCSLSAFYRKRAGAHLALGVSLGAALTPFTLHGQGLDTTLPVTRLDAGARASSRCASPAPPSRRSRTCTSSIFRAPTRSLSLHSGT